MGKTLETKKKILGMLRKREMTAAELSRGLGLSSSTVSQHLEELRSMGAVEKTENEHFKKLKYYKINEGSVRMETVKYVLGALVVIAAISALYLYFAFAHGKVQAPTSGVSKAPQVNPYPVGVATTASNSSANATAPANPAPQGAYACPMMTYSLNGSISGYSGLTRYYLNSSYGTIADYITEGNSTGTLNISEEVSNALSNGPAQTSLISNRTHFAIVTLAGTRFGTSYSGINLTFSPPRYNAVSNTVIKTQLALGISGAAQGTYWLQIDGPCGRGVPAVLLTVGSSPYTGNTTRGASIYS